MIRMNRSRPWARWLLLAAAATLAISACEERPAPAVAASTDWRDFRGSWNATGTRRTIPLGTNRQASIIELSGTMLLSGSARPSVGFLSKVIALVDSDTGLVGRAVWTDDRGDEVFSELKGEGTKENNHIAGTILGGTGRYDGASGSFEFSWEYVIELEDGSIQGRATGLTGRYRLRGPETGAPKQ